MAQEAKYRNGDLLKFKFKPDAYNIESDEVMLMGVVSGEPLITAYTKDIVYKIALVDEKRGINGTLIVPEGHIIERISFSKIA